MPQNSEHSVQSRESSEAEELIWRGQHLRPLVLARDEFVEKAAVPLVALGRLELRVRPIAAPPQMLDPAAADRDVGLAELANPISPASIVSSSS
jgi:hypothetical protein